MGSASVTSQYSDGYSSFTAYATITWDSTPTVTVSNVYGDNSAFSWRIRGQNPNTTVYLVSTSGSSSFTGSFGTSYVFQTCGANGMWNNTGDSVFTVSDGSSSGGGGGSIGNKDSYLYITQDEGTELTVELYTTYDFQKVQSGFLISAGASYKFRISCTALPGYELDKYEHLDGTGNPIETIGFTYTNLVAITETIGSEEYVLYRALGDGDDVTITSSVSPKTYTLSLLKDMGLLITVTRISSKQSDAVIGAELADGDAIYHFDELQVNFKADAGYDCSVRTASGQILSDGDIIQVSDNVSIVSEATVKQYTLTLVPDTGSTITVNRTSSPLQNATIGIINSNETIYYADVLKISLSSSPEYEILEQYVNQEEFTSGDIFEVQDDITVETITRLRGIAYIYNGASYNKYLIYIFNNGSWSQYIPYVYQDSKWNICS